MTFTTTPTFALEFTKDPGSYSDIVVTFYQSGVPRLVKHKEDLSMEGTSATLQLLEDETQFLNHSNVVVISVSIVDEDNNIEVVKLEKKLYYVFAEKMKVGFEDETTEILISLSSVSKSTSITVSANVINALSPKAEVIDVEEGALIRIKDSSGTTEQIVYDGAKGDPGHYTAGNGIDIKDDTISVKDLILDCDSSTELGG